MSLKDGLDDITDDLGRTFEEVQNIFQYKSQEQLMRYVTDPNWMTKQYLANGKFKINLLNTAKKELKVINLKYEKAFRMGLKTSKIEPSKEALERLEQIKRQNLVMMTQLANQVFQAHQKFINQVQFNVDGTHEIGELKRTNAVYNEISKVLSKKEAQEEYKAVYKDGKKFSFKSYMEMKARTTLNQEIGQQQMEAARNNGEVFFICSSFEDCRPSHISYQGKCYYNEDYTNMGFDEKTIKQIEQAISDRQMLSIQQVRDNEPFLSTCPNCRHEFAAIPIDDVISMTDNELLKANNMNVTKATSEKYELSQIQRSYERKIRDYKYKVEFVKDMINKAPKGSDTEVLQSLLNHDKTYLNKYYGKIRTLVKENSWMERDYKRESVKDLREDLGAKYNNYKSR